MNKLMTSDVAVKIYVLLICSARTFERKGHGVPGGHLFDDVHAAAIREGGEGDDLQDRAPAIG